MRRHSDVFGKVDSSIFKFRPPLLLGLEFKMVVVDYARDWEVDWSQYVSRIEFILGTAVEDEEVPRLIMNFKIMDLVLKSYS